MTDGVHTEPGLSVGKTYRLNVVCVGSGSARMAFSPTNAGPATMVPCDRSVVQRRLPGKKLLRVNIDAAKGATGVIAWQIDAI
ncbi:hypothetical protein ACIPJS_13065 [Streptomyces sp. NPDC086783]|uniref:hypothetical protein n=1 Tax=Streptomyces sp. NPDC086783 TaxID=3365758 RepID=UPI0038186ABE